METEATPGDLLPAVLVTREEPRPVLEAIEQSGGRAVALTLLRTRWLPFELPEDMTLDSYDIVAFTSARALQALDRVTREKEWNWPPASAAAAVGDRTAHELQAIGWLPESVAPGATGRSLASTLVRRGVRGKRILFPCSALADAILPDTCRRAGAQVDVVPVYTTEATWTGQPALRMELQRKLQENLQQGCVITCASPSAVKVLAQLAATSDLQSLLEQTPLVVIGPTTERAARKRSLDAIVSSERSLASLAHKAVEVARGLRR